MWTKHQQKHFLENNNVPFRADAFHQDLLAVASSNKPEKQYRVANIINAAGSKVLRLPPYHCHYNPIEMVRNNCKRYYKTLDGNQFDRAHVKQVWHDALQQVTAEKRLESRSEMGQHECRTHYHQFRRRHFERRRREVMKRMKMTVNLLLPHYQDHQERGIEYGKL